MMNPEKFKMATCARCHKPFQCFLFKNCWCEDIEIPEEVAEYMQLHYDGCVCKSCMDELIESFAN